MSNTDETEAAALLDFYRDASKRHRSGALGEARAMYLEVLERSPGHPGATTSLGVLHHQLGELDVARGYLEHARNLRPEHVPTIGSLGNLYQSMDLHAQAILCYEKVLGIQPGNPNAHNNLGNVLVAMRAFARAADSYRRALALDPNQPHVHFNLAKALASNGELADAAYHAREAIGIPDADALAAHLLRKLERYDEALAAYDRAIAARPDPDLYNGRGIILRHLDQLDLAEDAYRAALALQPNHPESLNNLGNLLGAEGRTDEAIELLQQAIAAADRPAFRANLGSLYMDEGRPEDAAEQYRASLALRPDHAPTLYDLGCALLDDGDFDPAVEALQRATTRAPDHAPSYVNLGRALIAAGDSVGALVAYQRANALLHDHGDALIGPFEISAARLRHDREQLTLLRERGLLADAFHSYADLVARLYSDSSAQASVTLHGEELQRLAQGWSRVIYLRASPALPAALTPAHAAPSYTEGDPLDITALVSDEARAELTRFCEESTVWVRPGDGALGAALHEGFASALLLQLAEALLKQLPSVLPDHRLVDIRAWKHDEGSSFAPAPGEEDVALTLQLDPDVTGRRVGIRFYYDEIL